MNPEAAHLYALEHADLLTKGTNPDLFDDPRGGGVFPDAPGPWDQGVAKLAASVLRIGLIDYPAQLEESARGSSAHDVVAAAEAAGRAAEGTMGDSVNALKKGVHVGPDGKLVLAEFLAANMSDVETLLTARDTNPSGVNLLANRDRLEETFKEVMSDSAARKVLLGGANTATAAWGVQFATLIGDSLEQFASAKVNQTIDDVASSPSVRSGAQGVGTLYGNLADAILANVKDQREAAAEMVGILGFLASQGFSSLATLGGAAIGGGVGALAAKFAAGELAKGSESLIRQADTRLKGIEKNDIEALRAEFKRMVRQNLHDMMVAALWTDPRIRARLFAGEPPNLPAGSMPPTTTPEGQMIDPPLVGDGGIRVPGPDDQPAHKLFFDWLERGEGRGLQTLADEALEESRILEEFETTVADHLFKRA
jgi:hypothetical protein